MKENILLQVPNLCHENWNEMIPNTDGRFCNNCAKTVVDFSVMTDNEVLRFLQSNTGKLCGHFSKDQLHRPIVKTELQPQKKMEILDSIHYIDGCINE